MHAKEFVLIRKRRFISKNQTKEEIFDNPKYHQKATQLSLLQRSNPNFEQSSEKNYKMLTQALIYCSREQGAPVTKQAIQMT